MFSMHAVHPQFAGSSILDDAGDGQVEDGDSEEETVLVCIEDITERKRAKETIRE